MKTKEELNALKKEVETVSMKLRELSEEELKEVTGGTTAPALPAKVLGATAYGDMFNGCPGLDSGSGLPATSNPAGDISNFKPTEDR